MGCATSASPGNRSGAQSTNGSVDAPLPEPVDPRLPLTARQRFSIQKSWKAIARNMETTGVTMFVKLFLQHEELLAVFKKKFKDVPVDQLAKSPELENHASQVMSTLDEAIHSLNNLNFFFELLYTIGVTHRDIAGFRPEYFWASALDNSW
ncbi:PREDICTED: globin-3-like [Priapulus caudatus]|uniref:Globin-3-like n=1 Tax=Priapulus caudatus TaxID=37621 RepID=A0ABM1EFI6_PRICU|nr:PREDICTED: globin-3-like [Priapulus caudatus]